MPVAQLVEQPTLPQGIISTPLVLKWNAVWDYISAGCWFESSRALCGIDQFHLSGTAVFGSNVLQLGDYGPRESRRFSGIAPLVITVARFARNEEVRVRFLHGAFVCSVI